MNNCDLNEVECDLKRDKKKASQLRGLNPRSTAYEAVALPLGQVGTCTFWVASLGIEAKIG